MLYTVLKWYFSWCLIHDSLKSMTCCRRILVLFFCVFIPLLNLVFLNSACWRSLRACYFLSNRFYRLYVLLSNTDNFLRLIFNYSFSLHSSLAMLSYMTFSIALMALWCCLLPNFIDFFISSFLFFNISWDYAV